MTDVIFVARMLSRNLCRYGLGGIIVPFIGIKTVDLIIQFLPGMAQ
jgi:K+-transporting ATPase ATPase B chain